MELRSRLRAERFVPMEAIVLYRQHGGQGRGFATVHDVQLQGEVPVIQAGKLLGTADMASMMMQMMPGRRLTFIDHRMLALSEHEMVWWMKPSKRAMWFNTNGSDGLGESFGAAWQPGLVFCAGECGWRVYAVKGDGRPDAGTPLYQAPYYNVNSEGLICRGSAELPERIGPDQMDAFEEVFFRSRFTHPNVHVKRELTRARGGAAGLWMRMLKGNAKCFPESTLVQKKMTLGGLIQSLAGRYE
jgi:PRTRC genetic system protein B